MREIYWLKECEICDAGLCRRMDELQEAGYTQRESARIMEDEAAECLGEVLWKAPQIRRRYLYHSGKRINGTNCTIQTEQNPQFKTTIFVDLQDIIDAGTRFGTILCDPPWKYNNQATRSATSGVYKPGEWGMSVESLKSLPVAELSEKQAHLHLWTTNAFLPFSFEIIEAWGFKYKGVFVWVKEQMGIGNYWRVSHEFLMLGVKGGLRFQDKSLKSWMMLPRTKHSVKPDAVTDAIEKASPGPYLELFARRTRPNWTVFGNEIERTLFNEHLFETKDPL